MSDKKLRRISIAVDMDGVLADTETHFIKYYETESGEKFDRSVMVGIPESQSFPDKTAVWRYVNTAGFFRTLPLIKRSVQAVHTLLEEFDVYIDEQTKGDGVDVIFDAVGADFIRRGIRVLAPGGRSVCYGTAQRRE